MLNFLRNFFKKLFGGGAATDLGPSTGTISAPETQASEDQEADTTSAQTAKGVLIEITRSKPGTQDTLGKLNLNGEFLCYTLENPLAQGSPNESNAIPAGSYRLKLRSEGGKHATYEYRFGEAHKGLLLIDGVPGFDFPHIHIGNEASHTYGSIVVGTSAENEDQPDQHRRVLYSEKAYLDLYGKVLPHLLKGEAVTIKIGS